MTTPDTIDWSHVAEGWDWMARDENGSAWLYHERPVATSPYWFNDGGTAQANHFASYRAGTCDWRESLIQRPGAPTDLIVAISVVRRVTPATEPWTGQDVAEPFPTTEIEHAIAAILNAVCEGRLVIAGADHA